MTHDEWGQMYNTLSRIHSEFQIAYGSYKNGRKKKIRDDGLKDAYHAIELACRYIQSNTDVYDLLTGQAGSSYSRAIMYDEFKRPTHFGGDLSDLLKNIQKKISV